MQLSALEIWFEGRLRRLLIDLSETAFHHFFFLCDSFLSGEEESEPGPFASQVSVTTGGQCPLMGNYLRLLGSGKHFSQYIFLFNYVSPPKYIFLCGWCKELCSYINLYLDPRTVTYLLVVLLWT